MLISNTSTRRSFLLCAAATAGVAAVPTASFALTTAGAEKLINRLTDDIFTVINSGKTGAPLYREFNRIFNRYAAVSAIARTTLGPPWRSASPAQQKAYVNAFGGYLSRKYGKRFREFIGAEIQVVSAKSVKRGVLVKSNVKLKGKSPFTVEWQVFDRGNNPQMFDLYIEGISMIKSEREEIGTLFDRSGGKMDKFIERLKAAG
ncbi:phospholipid-binding protein MlaC [Amylibacter sp. SFDW26]|uniref:MlaC/ttg2D family ABC transporter substrate-binding protein n=1 Tax=Amylibacter sp. SFDW26 TaxID=2652722 RepID=UPI001D00EDE1|nr:ABC transporter substrate-binding protein [Amylibacter sp. SFDW26]